MRRFPKISWPIGLVLAAALFVPVLKPLTGVRELMLAPDLALYGLALLGIAAIARRPPARLGLFALLCFVAFFFLAAAELFNPNVPSIRTGLEGFRKTALTSVAFFVALALLRTPEQTRPILTAIVAAGCVTALYGIKQAFAWSEFDDRIVGSNSAGYWTAVGFGERYRSSSWLSGPFHLGILGVQMFCLGTTGWIEQGGGRPLRWLAWASMALGAAAVIASQTRTNYIALAFLGGGYLLFTRRTYPGLVRVQIAGLAGLFLMLLATAWAAAAFGPEAILDRMNPMADNRFANRFTELREIASAIGAHPVRGYGMGSAGDALDMAFALSRVHFTSHNLALKLSIEMGVAGLAAFAGIALAWMGRLWVAFGNRHEQPDRWRFQLAMAALVAPVLFNGLTGSGIEAYPTNLFMWLGMGAAIGCGGAAEIASNSDRSITA